MAVGLVVVLVYGDMLGAASEEEHVTKLTMCQNKRGSGCR